MSLCTNWRRRVTGALTSGAWASGSGRGVGMAVVVAAEQADAVANHLEGAGEAVMEIGRIECGKRGCTVHGPAGTWNSSKDWSATHNA